ncbi:MAG: bifunctional diguanylate cyclase/phosphodiesterase [Actinomycetota bacterium]|nr:MAG: diguanylate cyclase/phosphodiesterase with PAS/PAC [Actinomycetota bacterium]MDO8949370.1 bifunctional diguanylate cyclase/phosphodiesterase [Actinomycetota bacterium]MDP3629379.1 bifunctional diguanylate cyclase/phosphodiesterase [Actinomycetota bacterium]
MTAQTESHRQDLFQNSPLPALVLERPGLKILAANARAEDTYGVTGGLTGTSAELLWRETERVGLEVMLVEAAAAGHRSGPWTHTDESGHAFDAGVYCTSVEFEGTPALLLIVTDLTDDLARERSLAEGATRDALTGVSNSAHFLDRLRLMVSRASHDAEYRFAVVYLDLDGFRQVNARVGHMAADRILAQVGGRLVEAVHPDDVVARTGGDEFAILSDVDAGGSGPLKLLERILGAFNSPFASDSESVVLSASLGAVIGGGASQLQTDAIIRNADSAMHRAKQQGHGRYEIFDESLQHEAERYSRTEADLRRGLEQGEFALYYQPIVTIPGGDMTAVEALLRWNHPTDGLLAPGAFISVAEDSGLIVPMGDWVIHEACRQVRVWREAGLAELSVSVNVSARQFKDGDVCGSLRDAISENGIEGRHLTTEITESIIMEDPVASAEIMSEIGSMGVKVAMDDFGTGYSSLSYLKRFHFDSLKIDRSFIDGIDSNAGDAAIVAAVIALAHSFRSHAVGEGVETPDQLQYLRLLKCDMAQGFLFSRPIPADDLAAIIQRGTPWAGIS